MKKNERKEGKGEGKGHGGLGIFICSSGNIKGE
jgi:hypothetical protein